MPKKKKPVPLWERDDLFFSEEGVSVISKPIPLVAAPTNQAPRNQPTPRLDSRKDYTVKELASEWHLSPDKIRELFRNEPGVVKLKDDNAYKKRKRPYVTLRIPPEVAARVKRRLS